MKSPGWLTSRTPKPRTAPPPALGTGKGAIPDARPLPVSGLRLEQVQHARCIDHVTIEGLRTPVCVLSGQDVDQVIAEALELGASS